MAPRIKHKRSALPNNPPTAGQIEAGELAINTNSTSANLHFEDDGGTVRSVGADPSAAGTYERNVATADGVGTWVVAGSQAPGSDDPYGHWDRDSTSATLSPRIAGDDIATTGDVQGGNFIFDQTTADVTLAAEDPAAARTYTFPDVGSDRGVVLDPDTPATTTQYAREITGAGVATWEELDIPPGTTIGSTPPLSPTEGQLWFNSDDGRLYIYYTDADSSQWVDASPDNEGEEFWSRTGTTLSPINAGDDIETTGNVSAANVVATGDIQSTSQNGGPFAGFRNQLINSTFRFWQRGTPPLAGTSAYTTDRWYTNSRAGDVLRQVQNTPPGTSFGMRVNTINALNLGTVQIRQGIELPMGGENYDIPTAGQFAVGSVWTTTVWSTMPVSLSLCFADSVTVNNKVDLIPDRSIMVDTGETSGDYTKYTFTSAPITGVPLSDSRCLLLRFTAEFTDVSDTWIIAQPQLEPGPVATPFETRPIGTELDLCQRFYQIRTSGTTDPLNLRPTMRITPTVSGNTYTAEL